MKVVHYNRLWKHKGDPRFSWTSSSPDLCALELESEANDESEPANEPYVQAGGGTKGTRTGNEDGRGFRREGLRKERKPPARFGDFVTYACNVRY